MRDQPEVQLFIMSYNRADLLRQTLISALKQDYQNLKIIISENSSTAEVFQMLQNLNIESNHKFEIRCRKPSLQSHDHFLQVLKEVSAPYFMIFHDDDIMEPNLISTLIFELQKNTTLSCAAGNAYLIHNQTRTSLLFNPQLVQDKIFISSFEFAKHYLDYRKFCLPFPGYLYRNPQPEILYGDRHDGGKYADAVMLLKFLNKGPILWKAQVLMGYRYHNFNDSKSLDLLGAFRLIRSFEKWAYHPRRSRLSQQYIIGKLTNHLRFHNSKVKLIKPILFKFYIQHPFFFFAKVWTSIKNKIRSAAR